jgi:hypothetical protein
MPLGQCRKESQVLIILLSVAVVAAVPTSAVAVAQVEYVQEH